MYQRLREEARQAGTQTGHDGFPGPTFDSLSSFNNASSAASELSL